MSSQSVVQQVLKYARRRGHGGVFTPRDLLQFGSRAAVDQALSRLARTGRIQRLARGLYQLPLEHPVVGQVPAAPRQVAEALARSSGAVLQPSGAEAANRLGLTTQVPGRAVFWTSGSTRRRRVGGTEVVLKQGRPGRLAGAGTPAGTVVQALRYLGPDNLTDEVIATVREKLKPAERRSLREVWKLAPGWAHGALRQIAAEA